MARVSRAVPDQYVVNSIVLYGVVLIFTASKFLHQEFKNEADAFKLVLLIQ